MFPGLRLTSGALRCDDSTWLSCTKGSGWFCCCPPYCYCGDGDGEDDDKMVMVLSELRQEPSDGNQTPNLADQLGRVAAAGYQTASKPKWGSGHRNCKNGAAARRCCSRTLRPRKLSSWPSSDRSPTFIQYVPQIWWSSTITPVHAYCLALRVCGLHSTSAFCGFEASD